MLLCVPACILSLPSPHSGNRLIIVNFSSFVPTGDILVLTCRRRKKTKVENLTSKLEESVLIYSLNANDMFFHAGDLSV